MSAQSKITCTFKFLNEIAHSESVTIFKSRVDSFRLKGYKENRLGHFWELSYDIYDRVEVNLNDRMKYTSFMKENPLIAKTKKGYFKKIYLG